MAVSFMHELLLELFRNRAELAPQLLREVVGIDLGAGRAELASADLTELVPAERRADAVCVLRGRDGARAAIIIEIQRGRDPMKRRRWPSYVTSLYARLGCPTHLLVLTDQPHVARWAKQPIVLGHPGMTLRPHVIELERMPRVIEQKAARANPELALLSALGHHGAAATRIEKRWNSDAMGASIGVYLERLYRSTPVLRGALEDAMSRIRDPEHPLVRLLERLRDGGRALGHVEGREEGHKEGRKEGREEGRKESQQRLHRQLLRAALQIARGKVQGGVTHTQRARLDKLDNDALTNVVVALGRAMTPADARAALSPRATRRR